MPTSSADRARRMLLATAFALAACVDGPPVEPPPPATCGSDGAGAIPLAPYQSVTLAADALSCAVLAADGEYLVIPQLTGAALPYGGYGFRIGDPEATPGVSLLAASTLGDAMPRDDVPSPDAQSARDAQSRLDAWLRAEERRLPVEPGRRVVRRPARGLLMSDAPALGSLRRFSVLNTLAATPTFSAVDARVRYAGSRVAIYLDTLAAASLSDTELQQMGALYDEALAPRILGAFGAGTDIDANGRVILLLTPTVNAMVSAASCAATGFVRGFFYGHDLASSAPTSNGGEVFYAYVPDPTSEWSCAHSHAEVLANLPPTFIHELQHMISYGAHVVLRGGANEEPWLNEGLSHIAEELGSLHWEAQFPSPSGRTDPAQIFPDSSAAYINPNVLYSYRFLFSSGAYSLTGCAPGSFCAQSERGGIWLLLRYLVDQRGDSLLHRLVQTPLTGRTNLEAATGASTAAQLADFAVAVWADSLEGVSGALVDPRHRIASRNLRAIYRRLFETTGIAGGVSRPFPIAPTVLEAGAARTGTMRPGSFLVYRIATAASSGGARMSFTIPDGTAFPASSGAQLVVYRIR